MRLFFIDSNLEVLHMARTDLEKLNGQFSLYYNGSYIVAVSEKCISFFTPDGCLVSCRKDLRFAHRSLFLSGDRMLVCSGKLYFHMIDLTTGQDLWTAPYVKCDLNIAPLAISPDEHFVYTFDSQNGFPFISRLDLNTHEVDTHTLSYDMGATQDILCDEHGVPHLLKTASETVGGKAYVACGVRIHDFWDIDPGSTTCWKTKWQLKGTRHPIFFYSSTDRILLDDFWVYEPATGNSFNLLENCGKCPDGKPFSYWLDHSAKYLCLGYQNTNVLIDTSARKIVAQYACDPVCHGCLIGNEYWVCYEGKLCHKPFPAFEDAPPIKKVDYMESYYAKHPELW